MNSKQLLKVVAIKNEKKNKPTKKTKPSQTQQKSNWSLLWSLNSWVDH